MDSDYASDLCSLLATQNEILKRIANTLEGFANFQRASAIVEFEEKQKGG